MRLTKSQSIAIAVVILVIFFLTGVLMVRSSRQVEPPLITESEGQIPESFTPREGSLKSDKEEVGLISDSPLTLKKFQRSEVRNGKKIWEISADEGNFYPEKNVAIVLGPDLFLYTEGGDKVRIQAERAELSLDGMSLKRAQLSGDVLVTRNNDIRIMTEQAVYDRIEDVVKAPGRVRLESETFQISGIGMEAQISKQIVQLLSQVETEVRARVN